MPGPHALATVWRRLFPQVEAGRSALDVWADQRFDAAVARRLTGCAPPLIVHAFESGALTTFHAAARLDMRRVLDVGSAHERYLEALRSEGAKTTDVMVPRLHAERELAEYLLAPSDQVVECLIEHGTPPERVLKLPYGTDPARFERVPSGRSGPGFLVLFVGQIGLRKGVRYLLEAWSRLRLPDSELVLVGAADKYGGDILRQYQGLYRWVGQVSRLEVNRWFERADVFAFPSLAEGSALVTYEAMAAGLPVITTASSGSVVRDRVDGVVVPARDAQSIAVAIEWLFQHREVGIEMGRHGRRRIEAGFTWDHYHSRLASVYEAVLAGRQPKVQDGIEEA